MITPSVFISLVDSEDFISKLRDEIKYVFDDQMSDYINIDRIYYDDSGSIFYDYQYSKKIGNSYSHKERVSDSVSNVDFTILLRDKIADIRGRLILPDSLVNIYLAVQLFNQNFDRILEFIVENLSDARQRNIIQGFNLYVFGLSSSMTCCRTSELNELRRTSKQVLEKINNSDVIEKLIILENINFSGARLNFNEASLSRALLEFIRLHSRESYAINNSFGSSKIFSFGLGIIEYNVTLLIDFFTYRFNCDFLKEKLGAIALLDSVSLNDELKCFYKQAKDNLVYASFIEYISKMPVCKIVKVTELFLNQDSEAHEYYNFDDFLQPTFNQLLFLFPKTNANLYSTLRENFIAIKLKTREIDALRSASIDCSSEESELKQMEEDYKSLQEDYQRIKIKLQSEASRNHLYNDFSSGHNTPISVNPVKRREVWWKKRLKIVFPNWFNRYQTPDNPPTQIAFPTLEFFQQASASYGELLEVQIKLIKFFQHFKQSSDELAEWLSDCNESLMGLKFDKGYIFDLLFNRDSLQEYYTSNKKEIFSTVDTDLFAFLIEKFDNGILEQSKIVGEYRSNLEEECRINIKEKIIQRFNLYLYFSKPSDFQYLLPLSTYKLKEMLKRSFNKAIPFVDCTPGFKMLQNKIDNRCFTPEDEDNIVASFVTNILNQAIPTPDRPLHKTKQRQFQITFYRVARNICLEDLVEFGS